jgi:hypothetical protein
MMPKRPLRKVPNAFFPSLTKEEAMVSLLLERAQRNSIKYQAQVRYFETKYNLPFTEFRQLTLESDPEPEQEQDYFDWEMATTTVEDMRQEIEKLSQLIEG